MAGICVLAFLELTGNAEVDEPCFPIGQDDDVFRFDIPMNYRGVLAVDDLQQGAEL